MRYMFLFFFGITLTMIGFTGVSFATTTISVESMGNGVYNLQGTNVDNAAAFDITITYDTSTLSNPSVSQGTLVAGGMMAVNVNTAGTVRMALIRLHVRSSAA